MLELEKQLQEKFEFLSDFAEHKNVLLQIKELRGAMDALVVLASLEYEKQQIASVEDFRKIKKYK